MSIPPEDRVVTAAIVVIGDEILSGRTQDKNIGYIATYLTDIGIDLKEVRIVADEADAIVEAVNAVRERYTYIFTTGGIGPTHDDITADSIACAFHVPIHVDQRAVDLLLERFRPEELNEGRLRMARIPEGADLIANPVSKAPGFRIGNVHVMAGVPSIMRSMLDAVAPSLERGARMLSETVRADAKEGDVAMALGAIQKAHSDVAIGSYPFRDEGGNFNTNLVVRGRDAVRIAEVRAEIETMLADLKTGVK